MIDTHAHIGLCENEADLVIEEAQRAGVDRIINIGLDLESSQEALALAQSSEGIYAAVGLHPNSAQQFTPELAKELDRLAKSPHCVAIGETGLDYKHDSATPEQQLVAFRGQIEIAREHNLPLIIHSREAEQDTVEILEQEASDLKVVIHCFSLTTSVERCIQNNWWTSFAGNLTYPSAQALREAAAKLPLNKLLVETDAPYLSPKPKRGKPNQPANVVHTAQLLAEIREISYRQLEKQLDQNTAELFVW